MIFSYIQKGKGDFYLPKRQQQQSDFVIQVLFLLVKKADLFRPQSVFVKALLQVSFGDAITFHFWEYDFTQMSSPFCTSL
jgi:hypothetical protein